MSSEDYYEGRIASLRTGIEMVLRDMQPGSLLSPEQKLELATRSLRVLLDSDLDKALGGPPEQAA